jgi:uncharacterized delta-60 repeat protein
MLLCAAPALAAPADLDTTFGAPNGFALVGETGGNVNGGEVLIDPSTGNYLVGANDFVGAGNQMGAMRFLPGGALDSGFGGESGATPGTEFVPITGETDTAETGMVRQSNGAIVLGGFSGGGGPNRLALVRLTAAGKLDTSFNSGGTQPGTIVTDLTPRSARIGGLGIQSSGKIVALGTADQQLLFARYNTNGTPDGTPVISSFTGIDTVQVLGAVVEPGDKILVGGNATVGTLEKFMVARLNADGSPDSTFGSGGIVTFTVGSPTARDFANAIAMQPDGDPLIAGEADQGGTDDMVVARLTTSGDLDPSFGSGGVSILSATPEEDSARALTLQPNGKVILAGSGGRTGEGTGDLALARLNANGTPDATFGTAGAVVQPIPGAEPTLGSGVAVQSDGKIVVSGTASPTGAAHPDALVARFLGGEVPPPPPPPPTSDTTKPKISKLKLLTKHLRTIRKTKKLKVRAHLSEPGTLTLKATISVKRSHHKARTITLSRKTVRFTKAATKTVTLKLGRKAISRLSKLHTLKIKLSLSAKDLAGNKSSRALTVKLRRR